MYIQYRIYMKSKLNFYFRTCGIFSKSADDMILYILTPGAGCECPNNEGY